MAANDDNQGVILSFNYDSYGVTAYILGSNPADYDTVWYAQGSGEIVATRSVPSSWGAVHAFNPANMIGQSSFERRGACLVYSEVQGYGFSLTDNAIIVVDGKPNSTFIDVAIFNNNEVICLLQSSALDNTNPYSFSPEYYVCVFNRQSRSLTKIIKISDTSIVPNRITYHGGVAYLHGRYTGTITNEETAPCTIKIPMEENIQSSTIYSDVTVATITYLNVNDVSNNYIETPYESPFTVQQGMYSYNSSIPTNGFNESVSITIEPINNGVYSRHTFS